MATHDSYNYTLNNFKEIKAAGFDFELPTDTIQLINKILKHVGNPSYVKTPSFVKKAADKQTNKQTTPNNENDSWKSVGKFKPTAKIEPKEGIDVKVDLIRSHMNKLTDINYIDMRDKIILLLEEIHQTEETNNPGMIKICTTLFDIASNNRFYSKIYADLYADLHGKYKQLQVMFETNIKTYITLFDNVCFVDPNENYDLFCKNNKNNEKRKALSAFFINLMNNGIIPKSKIQELAYNLFLQIHEFLPFAAKKNEVDELTENIILLYKPSIFKNDLATPIPYKINNMTIPEYMDFLSKIKPANYPGLSSKSMFKYMDFNHSN
jgi:hypothetical protein